MHGTSSSMRHTPAKDVRIVVESLLVATLVASLAAATPASDLEQVLHHPGLADASVAALVIDAQSGREVFAHHADTALLVASNVKILTALAALDTFGPTHRFTSRVLADRHPDASGTVGRLVLVGGGDPSLTSEQMWRLAADLARSGLRRIDGDIVLDAGAFDDQKWNPAWGQVSSRAYHAPIAGLSVNYGAFTVEVGPGPAPGSPLRAAVDPPIRYFSLVNRATTTAGGRTNITVKRQATPAGDRITVGGTLGVQTSPRQVHRSVSDPVAYAGHVFAQQLVANGVTVAGIRVGRALPGDVTLAEFEGKSLAETVRLLMKFSNNNIAESLVKAMGRAAAGLGSWKNGVPAMRQRLLALGVDGACFNLVDGSGLARDDRVAPRCLTTALRIGSRSFRYGPEFVASLPIAGRDGTLRRRARASTDRLRAKTGLLTGATALSGIVETRSRGQLVFSIVANGYSHGDGAAMDALDAFAAALQGL